MFINDKILKKLMMGSYKGSGLFMGNYDGYFYLGDPFHASWEAKIAVGCVPKTILAAMVECAGGIPQPEEAWTADKEKSQMEAYNKWWLNEPAHPEIVSVTPLFLQTKGGVLYRLVQLPGDNTMLAVNPMLLQAIDTRCIDRENEETMIEGSFYDGERGLYAMTNQAMLHIWAGHLPATDEIMDALNAADTRFTYDEDSNQ